MTNNVINRFKTNFKCTLKNYTIKEILNIANKEGNEFFC